jgi:hypothetical protein
LKMTAPIATPPMEAGSGKRPTTAVSTAPSNGVEIPEMTRGIAKYKYSLWLHAFLISNVGNADLI